MSKYICPRCKANPLKKDGRASLSKRQRWSCYANERETDGQRRKVYCYTTVRPQTKNARDPAGNERTETGAPAVFKRELREVKRFIVTAAQNATPVHKPFWDALQHMAKDIDAEILVIPIRYKNATSQWTASQENAEWWAPEVTPFLWNVRRALNSNITVMGDIKIQPTASQPLSSLDAMSGPESGIFGHTKLHMKVIPTPQHKFPKILTTTGVVTKPNYTDSKAGKLGEFHHHLGAVVVEVVGKTFHLRHLSANPSGEFTDLTTRYTPDGKSKAPRPAAVIMGDTHVDAIDPDVEAATFGTGGILDTLNPQHVVWHDTLDGYSANPHHRGNPFIAVAKRQRDLDNIEAEIRRAVWFVRRNTKGDRQSIIVASNHDDFIRRYMLAVDWRDDPTNAEFYLHTALAMVQSLRVDKHGTGMLNPFAYWFEKLDKGKLKNIKLLRPGEPFTLRRVALDMHGDRGPSGARGSINNLRRIGLRSFIAHGHSPGIDEGCWQVGTSTALSLEYTEGPGAWLNTHGILHDDGKRQLITIINGEWHA